MFNRTNHFMISFIFGVVSGVIVGGTTSYLIFKTPKTSSTTPSIASTIPILQCPEREPKSLEVSKKSRKTVDRDHPDLVAPTIKSIKTED